MSKDLTEFLDTEDPPGSQPMVYMAIEYQGNKWCMNKPLMTGYHGTVSPNVALLPYG